MDNLVPKEGNEESADSDDDDTSKSGDVAVNGMNEFGANNGVHARPANASQDVEERNYAMLALWVHRNRRCGTD